MHLINKFQYIGRRVMLTLFALILSVSLYAQKQFKGTVVDESDLPLIGATVAIEGSSGGTITDMDGNFIIKVKKGAKITFSYVGYKSRTLTYQGQNNVTVKLEPDSKLMDEVVVVGYSSMKKTDLTGSIASVAPEDLQGFKSSSIAGALSGQVAGVQVIQSDGAPGSSFNINIRGVGTLTGDNSPLYIVDGFQVDDISYLSDADIESMQILKDASSSAIYGSRAANGVVLITTRQGKESKPIINYKGSASYRNIPAKLNVLNPYEFVKLQGEINENYKKTYYQEGNDSDGNPYRYQTLDDYIGVEGVDWQDETFNPTWSQDHSLTITGGNDKSKYAGTFSRYTEEGIFNNSGFDRTTAKFRVDQKVSNKVSFNATVNYALTNKKGAGTTADNGRFNMLA